MLDLKTAELDKKYHIKYINRLYFIMSYLSPHRFGHYSSTRRWQSVSSQPLQLHNLSAGQLMILRRLSVLKLTALMEKYASGNNAGNGGNKTTNLSWLVFYRRIKSAIKLTVYY